MMKRFLIIASFLLLWFAPHAHAAISIVGATSTRNGCTLPSCTSINTLNVAAGKTLVVGCGLFLGSTTSTVTNVTSTGGDTFTKLIDATTSTEEASLWYATSSIANAAEKITCTWANSAGAANSHVVSLAVYSGAGGGIELFNSSSSASSANPWTIPTSTPSQTGEVVIGFWMGQGLGQANSVALAPATLETASLNGNDAYVDYGSGSTLAIAPYSVGVSGAVSPGHWLGVGAFLIPTSTTVAVTNRFFWFDTD